MSTFLKLTSDKNHTYAEVGSIIYDTSCNERLDGHDAAELDGEGQLDYFLELAGVFAPRHAVDFLIIDDVRLNGCRISNNTLREIITAYALVSESRQRSSV